MEHGLPKAARGGVLQLSQARRGVDLCMEAKEKHVKESCSSMPGWNQFGNYYLQVLVRRGAVVSHWSLSVAE